MELSGDSGGAKVGRIIKEQNPFDKRTWNPEYKVEIWSFKGT